jgi:hypothetical protein
MGLSIVSKQEMYKFGGGGGEVPDMLDKIDLFH